MVVEIHCQKGEVVRPIEIAETIVELDAVVDRKMPRTQMNMLEAQIAMAIANSMFTHPPRKETGIATIKFSRKAPNRFKSRSARSSFR